MIKKIFSIIIKLFTIYWLVFALLVGVIGGGICGAWRSCYEGEGYREIEQGDWLCYYSNDEVYIKGLTESGKQKTLLVVPLEVDGNRIKEYRSGVFSKVLKSDKLESLYLTHDIGYIEYECPNLSKVVIISWDGDPSYFGCTTKYNCKTFVRNSNIEERTLHKVKKYMYYANTNFYYNYENAPSQGVYWIDNFDWGGKVEYIPQNPMREGYIFAGWYLEPECANELNVDSFTMPQEELDENEKVLYQETAFYAKWIKN